MKATILNGAGRDEAPVDHVSRLIAAELESIAWMVTPLTIRDIRSAHCLGCFDCWVKTPGICAIADPGRDISRMFIQSDMVVFVTAVRFGGYSAELKKAIDRIIGLVSPFFIQKNGETHHKLRYDHYPRLMVVGTMPHADPESEKIFTTLAVRNALNFHPPAYSVGILSQEHGEGETRARIQSLLSEAGVTQ